MKSNFIPYLKKLLVISVLLELVILFFFQKYPQYNFAVAPYLILFFIVISIGTHYFLLKAAQKRAQLFTAAFMGSIGIKLLLCFGFLIIYVLLNKNEAKHFIVTFFVLYLVFTTFEVLSLLKFVNTPQANSK
jgi:hypothetical protein